MNTNNPPTRTKITLPNVRKIIVPDTGYVIFDGDLTGADAQVVAWEAEDDDLKTAFRGGLDIHDKNAEDMLGAAYTKLAGDKDNGPKSRKRKEFKQFVHLTNYGGTARAVAMVLGWTMHEGDQWQKRWFSAHPGIKKNFHGRIQDALNKPGKVITNIFGFHRVYFDRPDQCFTQALAWKPQSVVALTTYYGAKQLEEVYPWVQILLQDHDNLVWQFPMNRMPPTKDIISTLSVRCPYDDPLTIPWGLAASTKSWGDCEAVTA